MDRNYVRLEAADLSAGESIKTLCPVCRGGSTAEHSFSLTHTGSGVLYHCYRATCPVEGGFIPTGGEYLHHKRPPKKAKERHYHGEVRGLEEEDCEYFLNRFGLMSEWSAAHIYYNERDEYVFPIYTPQGLERGYVTRQPVWSGDVRPPRDHTPGKAKARSWPSSYPCQSWYPGDSRPSGTYRGNPLVLVEDQLSAICTSQEGINCVALLGTNLTLEGVREIAQQHPSEVLIALDEDATNVSFKLARRWGLAFQKTRVVPLKRDLKEEDDIWGVLGL